MSAITGAKRLALTGALSVALLCQASAMEFRQLTPLKNGDFTIVASGEIFFGDDDKFTVAIGDANAGVIYLSSPGGNAWAGMRIGAIINSRSGFVTMVAKGDECYSACALAWLGARTRGMFYGSIVGFHGAFITNNGRSVASAPANAVVGAYLSKIGLSIDAIMFITKAEPNVVAYLNPFNAEKYSIRVALLSDNDNEPPEWYGEPRVEAANPVPAPTQPAMDAKVTAKETAEEYQGRLPQGSRQGLHHPRS